MRTTIVRWTQRVMFAVGVSLLSYCGVALTDTWMAQASERLAFDRLVSDGHARIGAALRTTPAVASFHPRSAVEGDLVGRIDIPRLNTSVMVIEGTGATTLRRAVGHIPGTALPGEAGNVGLSGHRDTFFRALRNIRRSDTITLTTLFGEYRYRVVSIKVVDPHDVAVLDAGQTQTLTLVTCYPFFLVGSAPDRFIVRAERFDDER